MELNFAKYPTLGRLFADGLGETKGDLEATKRELEKLGKTIR
jgi:hypothetical protein